MNRWDVSGAHSLLLLRDTRSTLPAHRPSPRVSTRVRAQRMFVLKICTQMDHR